MWNNWCMSVSVSISSCFWHRSFFLGNCVFLSLCSGPNIYSQSMASLSGDIETPFSLTTTGHQLLLRWSSDHGTNRRGFHIRYVGEYQSMYPVYNHISSFYWCFWICLVSKLNKVMKVMGLQVKRLYLMHCVVTLQLNITKWKIVIEPSLLQLVYFTVDSV